MSQANKPQRSGPFMNVGSQITPISLMSSANNLEEGIQSRQDEALSRGYSDLGLHRTQMKSTTIDRLSKVLLLIFSNKESRTNQDLFEMFSPFVRVIRVLIFERKDSNMKCFIEMMSLPEATYVKNQFSFQKANNPQQKSSMQIYYAQIQTIDLQNHYSEGHDYSSFYANNPHYTCQFFRECDSSAAFQQQQPTTSKQSHFVSASATSPSAPTPPTTGSSSMTGNGNTHTKPQFGALPQIGQNSQYMSQNYATSELDNILEQQNEQFFDQQSAIRPRSIQSIDYHQLQFGLNRQTINSGSAGKIAPRSQFSGVVYPNRRTLHTNPVSSGEMAATLESKVYAHIPVEGHLSSVDSIQATGLERHRNHQADQFHKDFLMKDGILQNHINQQLHSQQIHPGMISNHYQQPRPLHKPQLMRPYFTDHIENRSPSATTFSFQQDMTDVDENVMVCHPSAFLTKYRDELFFNGGNETAQGFSESNCFTSNQVIPQQMGMFEDGNENSQMEAKRVLFVRHLDNPELKISMIYNVFSNYGNIVKILFMKQKRQALIEFETTPQACAAKEYLNNLMYYGAQLKLDFSKYDQIDLQRKKLHTGESNDQEQVLQIPSQCYRYKANSSIPQYAPKPMLHVSNIRKEYFDSNLLYELFSKSGARVVMIKPIPNEKKQMCLVQLETLDDALRVISTLHDQPFYGRNLCISFTKNPLGEVQHQQLNQGQKQPSPPNQKLSYQAQNEFTIQDINVQTRVHTHVLPQSHHVFPQRQTNMGKVSIPNSSLLFEGDDSFDEQLNQDIQNQLQNISF